MKAEELTVQVKAKMDVSRSTAEACLKMVEIYVNEHPNIRIIGEKKEDGTDSFHFEELED